MASQDNVMGRLAATMAQGRPTSCHPGQGPSVALQQHKIQLALLSTHIDTTQKDLHLQHDHCLLAMCPGEPGMPL